MKTLFTLFIIIISYLCIYAQNREVISEKHLYDFCHCDYIGDTLITGYNEIYKDEISDSLNQLPIVKGSLVFNGEEIMFLRIFYNSTMNIKEEYVKLNADTFHYVRHDDTNKHKTLERGTYYFDKNNTLLDSTYLVSYDPNTYDELREVNLYYIYPKVKHGDWMEKDSTKSMYGTYVHGKRNDDWYFHHFGKSSTTKIIYQNDKIISEEELNLINKENNLKELENVLTDGSWRWFYSEPKSLQRRKENPKKQGTSDAITFLKNYTYQYKLKNNTIKGTWKISLENKTLTIDNKIYNIDWFRPTLIQFAPEEK